MSRIHRIIDKILAGAFVLLGFSACSTDENNGSMMCMYGTPQGNYEISGTVYDEDGKKLDGAMVTTSERDTVYTENGAYRIGPKEAFPVSEMDVKAEDPKGNCIPRTQKVKLKYTGGKEWDKGEAKAVADFHLTKNIIPDE